MTTIHLVRHAAVVASFDGICFGQRGDPPIAAMNEADATRLRVTVSPGSTVFSSPARRARETATLLASRFIIDGRWSERDFGTWEGRPWADCWTDVPAAHLESADSYVEYTPDGAGQHADVVARVRDALDDAARSGTDAVVVTHAGPIRAALLVAGLSLTEAFATDLPSLSATSLTSTSNGWTSCAKRQNQ